MQLPTNKPAVVTCGLPYANGELHVGHLRTYVAGDFYSRALKQFGQTTAFVCGSDMHGTPIAVNAHQEGVEPGEFARRWHDRYREIFPQFDVDFDNYGHTDDKVNRALTRELVRTIDESGYTYTDTIKVAEDARTGQPLPDRYVTGTCPYCGAEARGDECDQGCERHLEPGEIENPESTLTGNRARYVESEHKFFRLTEFREYLSDFLNRLEGTQNAKNQPRQWLDDLRDWCITRDLDWGIDYPGRDDLVLYVWVDAPIEYISSTRQYSERASEYDWEEVWKKDGEIIHVIGRDIIQHHTIFWPALLKAVEYNEPRAVLASGFVNQGGEALSTSRGNVVALSDYLESDLPTDYLRFYLLTASPFETDVNFTAQAFKQRINDELVNKVGNFVNRVASLADAHFETFEESVDDAVRQEIERAQSQFKQEVGEYRLRSAATAGVELAEYGNEYLQQQKPWEKIDDDPVRAEQVIRSGLQLVKGISVLLEPVIPHSAERFRQIIGEKADLTKAADAEGIVPEPPFTPIDDISL